MVTEQDKRTIETIKKIIKEGHDVEIRKNKKNELCVMAVKRNKVGQLEE